MHANKLIDIGIKIDATRNVLSPLAAAWIPAYSFELQRIDDPYNQMANFGSLHESGDKGVAKYNYAGKMEVPLNFTTINYFMYLLMGSDTSVDTDGAYTRTFALLENAAYPTSTFIYTRAGQWYRAKGVQITEMEINAAEGTEHAKLALTFQAIDEEEYTAQVAAYTTPSEDVLANAHTAIMHGDENTVAATMIAMNSVKLALKKETTVKHALNQSRKPIDVFTTKFTTEFEFSGIAENKDFYDIGTSLTYKSFKLDFYNAALPNIGTSSLKPRFSIEMPKTKPMVTWKTELSGGLTEMDVTCNVTHSFTSGHTVRPIAVSGLTTY